MKNKRLVYLLLPLVALVWGLIGWRIWTAAGAPEAVADSSAPTTLPTLPQTPAPPPRLLLSYGDPFKAISGARPAAEARPTSVAAYAAPALAMPPAPAAARLTFPVRPAGPPAVVAAAVTWPQVKYLGAITHASGQVQVALLSIDNEEAVVKVGQSAHAIQVLHLFRDSVQVAYRNQKRSFYRIIE